MTARLSKPLGDVGIGNRYDVARFNEAEFIFLSCDFDYRGAMDALKRQVFRTNGNLAPSDIERTKANPLGKIVQWKCVFPSIL
jgi:hypothetical protein